MTACAFLEENPNPSVDEIRMAISGNLCRCTGYQNIIEAIAAASATMANTAIGGKNETTVRSHRSN